MSWRSEADPNQMHVKPHHTQRVPVWSGISAFGVISPYFLEDETGNAVTVTSDRHVRMVNEFLFPELHRHDIDLATMWWQQDEKTTRPSMDALRTAFEHRIIPPPPMGTFLGNTVPPIYRLVISFLLGLLEKQSASSTSGRLT